MSSDAEVRDVSAERGHVSTSIRVLLTQPDFALVPVTDIPPAVLDAPLVFAHSSDLPDPTPWLESGQLLLTDGSQFTAGRTSPDEYVARLVASGILALGFATHVVHDGIPPGVAAACRAQQLPLLEVANRSPFMAIIRFVSDAVAAEQRRQLEESLTALRSVARAALRPDGLAATLRELEKNLGCWVALFDAGGRRIDVPTLLPVPDDALPTVSDGVRHALHGRRPSGSRLTLPDGNDVTLQSLGGAGHLRGILAVGTGAALDRAGNDLVDSVIALASIALEQTRAVDDARRRLRSGIAELMHAGVLDIAGGAARPLWGELPKEPIRVGLTGPVTEVPDGLLAMLELAAERPESGIFFAEREDRLLFVVSADDLGIAHEALTAFHTYAGFSSPADWADFASAEDEARRAAEWLSASDQPVVLFESIADAGLIGHLEVTGAHALARRMLRPLVEHDPEMTGTLRVWLQHNGAWDPAARDLGIHRHTLRARIETAGRLLGMDLTLFSDRAELWQALQLTRSGG